MYRKVRREERLYAKESEGKRGGGGAREERRGLLLLEPQKGESIMNLSRSLSRGTRNLESTLSEKAVEEERVLGAG